MSDTSSNHTTVMGPDNGVILALAEAVVAGQCGTDCVACDPAEVDGMAVNYDPENERHLRAIQPAPATRK